MSEWAPASSVGGLFQSAPAGPAGASPQPAAAYTYARPHRGGAILALGIVSIVVALTLWCSLAGLICGIIALNMSKKDLPLLQAGQMDPRGLGITQAGRICGIVGTILSSLMLVLLLVYVIFIVGMFAHM